jgi:hypothetical protein
MLASALAETPALPLHEAGKYVAGAYVVLFALVLIYLAIMAIRLGRIDRELGELLSMSERPAQGPPDAAEHDQTRESTPAYPMKGHT